MKDTRRSFLRKAGTSLAVGAVLPHIWIKKGRAANREIRLGHQSHRYRVIEGWGILDAGKNPVNDCHEMVADAHGRLLMLTNEVRNNVLIYDRSGKLLEAWGTSYPGAHGLSLATEGAEQFLFITDTERHQVIKTDMKGKEIFVLDYPKEVKDYTSATTFKPTETAINPANGDIYVADGYGKNFIIQYDSAGKYIHHFGGTGDTDDTFRCCHGLVVDTRKSGKPTLLITDRSHMCFKRFTLDGNYMETIALPGSFVCRPVIKGENLFAAVYRSGSESLPNSGYISILNENNQVVSSPGGTAPEYVGKTLKEQKKDNSFQGFLHPHDVCIDQEESIYIPQWASGKTYPIKLERI